MPFSVLVPVLVAWKWVLNDKPIVVGTIDAALHGGLAAHRCGDSEGGRAKCERLMPSPCESLVEVSDGRMLKLKP